MIYEFQKRGVAVSAQVPVPIVYESVRLDTGFRADLIVEDLVIIEIKSLEKLAPVHKKQLTTYLKLSGKRHGLIINFGEDLIKDGIIRIVNGLPDGRP
jgi:GxxExxY protein